MKIACLAILALLFASTCADDAERLGLKCPVQSKFFKERVDATKFEKLCLKGKPTGKNCDSCFEFVYSSIASDLLSSVDIPSLIEFYTNPEFTLEEKNMAIFEACSVKMKLAMKAKGVSENKLKRALRYPNGDVYKCPWELREYPKLSQAVLENLGQIVGASNLV